MARVRAWWTFNMGFQDLLSGTTIDLLEGSGLAVDGATVQRCIGTIDIRGTRTGSGGFLARLSAGLRVTDTPAAVDPAADNGVDWLWCKTIPIDSPGQAAGDPIGTSPDSTANSWDVAGQRLIGAGESVHVVVSMNAAVTGDAVPAFFFARTLVLGPDV